MNEIEFLIISQKLGKFLNLYVDSHFRQLLYWPLQLYSISDKAIHTKYWFAKYEM